jgi:hypothetical protein
MSAANSDKKAHNDAQNLAEGMRQAAIVPGASFLTIRNVEIAFYRAVARSALANGVQPSSAMVALKGLGVTGL